MYVLIISGKHQIQDHQTYALSSRPLSWAKLYNKTMNNFNKSRFFYIALILFFFNRKFKKFKKFDYTYDYKRSYLTSHFIFLTIFLKVVPESLLLLTGNIGNILLLKLIGIIIV